MAKTLPRALVTLTTALFLLAACEDNIGRAFDPQIGGPGGGGDANDIAAMVSGGFALDGRPKVRDVFPRGGGFPTSTPIVVTFSESINPDTVLPTSPQGTDALVFVRPQGGLDPGGNPLPGGTPVPASYDFLSGNRVLIIRPVTDLQDLGVPYEVIIDPEVRDVDGIRFGGTGQQILAEFTVDQDPNLADGEVLTVLPVNNAADVPRETEVIAVFTKAPDSASVTTGSFRVRTAAGVPVSGTLDFPLRVLLPVPTDDTRVACFLPSQRLAAGTGYQIEFTSAITFPQGGVLDFFGRVPYAVFNSLLFSAPDNVTVGNPLPGFPDKINRSNFDILTIDVDLDASAGAGDVVIVRVYGGDPTTTATGDVDFEERTVSLAVGGSQRATVDFTGLFGTLAAPRFEDGPAVLAAQVRRGGRYSGYVLPGGGSEPSFDLTLPTLSQVGAPSLGSGNDLATDQESLVFMGTASEEVGDVQLTDGVSTVSLFAAESDGTFMLDPLFLGRRTGALAYTLTLTDAAGNMVTAALTGDIHQRGVVTGTQAGTLTVEAYDQASLRVIGGAAVILDPGVPAVPASGQLTGVTGIDGRATFTGLLAPSYTITVVVNGYHLVTLYDTGAAFASLPLRPEVGATATLAGTAFYQAIPNTAVLVGSNAFDDRASTGVLTPVSDPTMIPAMVVRPGRPQLLTAFAGIFEPLVVPSFSFFACQICGLDGLTQTVPRTAPDGGQTGSINLALLPAVGTAAPLAITYTKDLGLAGGFDAVNLNGSPVVRLTSSMAGFGGQVLIGAGPATSAGGTSWTVNGTYAFIMANSLPTLTPVAWVVLQAEDLSGALVRHRALLIAADGTVVDTVAPPGVPTIAVPGAPFTSAPLVAYEDRLDRTVTPAGLGLREVSAVDASGRRWSLLLEDTNGSVGPASVQFPDLTGAGVVSLATGAWSVTVEDWLFLSTTMTAGDLVLEERLRQEVLYSRASAVTHTVN